MFLVKILPRLGKILTVNNSQNNTQCPSVSASWFAINSLSTKINPHFKCQTQFVTRTPDLLYNYLLSISIRTPNRDLKLNLGKNKFLIPNQTKTWEGLSLLSLSVTLFLQHSRPTSWQNPWLHSFSHVLHPATVKSCQLQFKIYLESNHFSPLNYLSLVSHWDC